MLLHDHLRLDPPLQAVEMDSRTAALAAARGHKEVVCVVVLAEADLALANQLAGDFVYFFVRSFVGTRRNSLFRVLDLRHDVFNPAELDDVSDFWC